MTASRTHRTDPCPWYAGPWMADTASLSDAAYRIYHRMLLWMWERADDRSSIPDEPGYIAMELGVPVEAVSKALDEVRPLLRTEGRAKRLWSKRLRQVWQQQQASRSEAVPAEVRDAYRAFIADLNTATGKHYRETAGVQARFASRWREGYGLDDFRAAIRNAAADRFHREAGYRHLTPDFLCRPEKLEKWLNAAPGSIRVDRSQFRRDGVGE